MINTDTSVICRGNTTIGSNTLIGQNVLILDHDHDYSQDMNRLVASDTVIGSNCWIGANAIILRGSQIGDNVVIGAGTIIKGTVPDSTVVYNKQNLVYKPYLPNK